MSLSKPPYPVEELPTIRLPCDRNSWYFKRYSEATSWRQWRDPKELEEFFSIGGNILAFRSTTPVNFIRTTWEKEQYKIEFFDWKAKLREKIVSIEPSPCRFYCLCSYYGSPNGTVVITRLKTNDKKILVGFQDHNGIYITVQPESRSKKEICEKFFEVVLNRSRAQRIIQVNGAKQKSYVPFSQEFCAKDHLTTVYHSFWCWLCRGVIVKHFEHISRNRTNVRVCTCKERSKVELAPGHLWYDNDIVRDEVEFNAHNRDFFKVNLPWYRAHADPLLHCLD